MPTEYTFSQIFYWRVWIVYKSVSI